MNNYLFFFAIISIFFLYIGIQKPAEVLSDNYLNYVNYNNEFTMKYPADWSIDDTEYACSDFSSTKNILTISSDRKEDAKNKILFFIEDIKNNISNFALNEYAFQRLNFYKDFGNIIQFDTNSKLGNNTAYTVVLEYNPNTSSLDVNTNNSSTIIGEIGALLDSKIYRISYITEKLQKDDFLQVLNQIVNSFRTSIVDNGKNNTTPFSWDSYILKNGNNKYSVNYDMSGLSNSLITIKPLYGQGLLLKMDAPNDGYLLLEIPRKLLDSKLQNKTDYKFYISTDNKPNTPYEEISSNSNYRTLKIEINDEDRIIIIGGNKFESGRITTINCSELIFPPITIEEKKDEEKAADEIPNISKGLRNSFSLESEGQNYTIDTYSINKGIDIKNLEMLNVDTLLMDIDSSSTGILEITVPRKLLDAKENGQDVPFSAVDNAVNRTLFPEEVNITNQSRTLSIPFTNETTFIMIMSLS